MDPETLQQLRRLGLLNDEQLGALEALSDLRPADLEELERTLAEDVYPAVRDEARRRIDAGEDVDEAIVDMEAVAASVEAVRSERGSRPDPRQLVAALSERITGESESGEGEGEGNDPAPSSGPRRMPRAPASRRLAPTQGRGATITAGGQPLGGADDLGRAFTERVRELRGRGAVGKRYVAQVAAEYPEDRRLSTDPVESTRRIDAVVAAAQARNADAIIADGGLCAPVNVSYDVFGVSEDHRPLRDGLVRFGADRGGIRFIAPPQLSDVAAGVTIITEAEDEAGTEDKPCVTITCGEETEETVSAVSQCLELGNFHDRTHPESVQANLRVLAAEHARTAETELWDRMVAASTAVTAGQNLGFYRDFVENLIQATAGMRSRHRVQRTVPVRVVAPAWVAEMAGADLLRQIPGDQTYNVGEAFLRRSLAPHNIVLTLTPDTGQEFTAQTAGPLHDWPDQVEVLAFFEGTFLFLDNGMLDLGVVRDSTLNRSNNLQVFAETFEGVAMVGVESLHLTMDVCPSGESSGTVDFSCEPVGS